MQYSSEQGQYSRFCNHSHSQYFWFFKRMGFTDHPNYWKASVWQCHYFWSSLCLSDALSCGAYNNRDAVPIIIHPGSKFVPRLGSVLSILWPSTIILANSVYWLMISSHYVIFLFAERNLNRLQVNALCRRRWTFCYRMPSGLCSLLPTVCHTGS